MSRRRVAVLGSTGSVGVQALQVIDRFRDRLELVGLAAGSNAELLARQASRWHPAIVALAAEEEAGSLERLLGDDVRCVSGAEGTVAVATDDRVDLVLNAIVGAAGLVPTYEAVRAGKTVALANKESMVIAGEPIVKAAREAGVSILPVDSEHNALHQCLRGNRIDDVARIVLTASGGPFFGRDRDELVDVTPEEALAHPTWDMGRRISIDSATLMNKGLEIIEANRLFGVPPERIEVVIHPQSAVHSLVEFIDGSMLAQAGPTDMRLPIQDTLSHPERWPGDVERLSLAGGGWEFHEPDHDAFPALGLARRALEAGGTAPAVLNGADESAVEAFLEGRIRFLEIPEVLATVLDRHRPRPLEAVDDALEADGEARELAEEAIVDMEG